MKLIQRAGMRVALMITTAAMLSCSTDISRNTSPVDLVVTNSQSINQIDLAGNSGNSTGCSGSVGTINVEVRAKNPSNVDQQFNDVRITRYRVSYVRTDGGTAVPAPFVRSIDFLVKAAAGSTPINNFVILTSEQLNQAPFASLLPTNGGRDPQTGRTRVDMDVVVELFGQTLAGTNVSGTTRFTMTFCFNCGGCA